MEAVTALNFGGIQNHLGLLNDKRNAFYPNRLLEITGESPTTASEQVKIPRASFYKDEVLFKRNKELERKIIDFVVVGDLVYELMNGNMKEVVVWLTSPNLDFFGDSPFEICLRGDGKKIIEWLYTRLGRSPGVAF